MQLKYNNIENTAAHGLVTFSDVPNIISVTDSRAGTKANITLSFNNTSWASVTSADSQWYITIFGETITNVTNVGNAVNKNFYISSSMTDTAYSICQAFRNCPTVGAAFKIYVDRTGINQNVVTFEAREIGKMWENIGDILGFTPGMSTYMSYRATNGTATSTLVNSKINVDIYSDGYITTLEKNYYGGECAFNITPVLSTISKYNKTVPYDVYITSISDGGVVSSIGSVTGNNASIGYVVNQGDNFLTIGNSLVIAHNVARGKLRSVYNSSILYVYEDTIPLSFYTKSSGDMTVTISYKNSAYQEISSGTYTQGVSGDNLLYTITVPLVVPSECFYVDLTISGRTLRYDVIKPLNASYGCQRVYWINSYGGTSFFDFAGQKTIENTSETLTYNKNHLDYYTSTINEKEKVYNVDTKTVYTVKTHLIAEDGKWQLYDLLQSPYAWTNINGEDYLVIIESVSEVEQNNQQIYEITVKIRISQPTSL